MEQSNIHGTHGLMQLYLAMAPNFPVFIYAGYGNWSNSVTVSVTPTEVYVVMSHVCKPSILYNTHHTFLGTTAALQLLRLVNPKKRSDYASRFWHGV